MPCFLNVTSASPCCQPKPISVPPQYWHCFTGSCFVIAISSIRVFCKHTIAETLTERLAKARFEGYTLTLKVKYADFTQITRSHTGNTQLKDMKTILPLAKTLVKEVAYDEEHKIRLLGLSVSNPKSDSTSDTQTEQTLRFSDYPAIP